MLCGDGDTYVVSGKVVNVILGQHGVILELRLLKWGAVASDNDEFGFAKTESLEGRFVAESDWRGDKIRVSYFLTEIIQTHLCQIS